jgi:hypothetical protein
MRIAATPQPFKTSHNLFGWGGFVSVVQFIGCCESLNAGAGLHEIIFRV